MVPHLTEHSQNMYVQKSNTKAKEEEPVSQTAKRNRSKKTEVPVDEKKSQSMIVMPSETLNIGKTTDAFINTSSPSFRPKEEAKPLKEETKVPILNPPSTLEKMSFNLSNVKSFNPTNLYKN